MEINGNDPIRVEIFPVEFCINVTDSLSFAFVIVVAVVVSCLIANTVKFR